MKIDCTLNGVPVELGDEADLQRHLVVEAALSRIYRTLHDVRDPETGEPVRITVIPTDNGANIEINGPQGAIDEADKRLESGPLR